MKRLLYFLLMMIGLAASEQAGAQALSSAELKLKKVLHAGNTAVPKTLQNSKTIVIVSIDNQQKSRDDWHAFSEKAHFYVQRLGIDAVLYFYVDDILAGYDVRRAVAAQLNARDVKNVFLLSKDLIDGRVQYIGVITDYNRRPDFVSNDQPAWKSQTSDLEILFRNLARAIDRADLKKENLLVLDQPEYFHGVKIIRGKRFESFNTDLHIDRLAVPKYEDLPLPKNTSAQSASTMVQLINAENSKNLERNAQLEQIMARYPYKYKIIPYEYDEKKLLAKGFQFVLLRLSTSGKNVRKMLGYKISDDIQELITMKKDSLGQPTLKAIPIDNTVYKYYIKHINSGDIYLGEQWDGDDNWQEALSNHMTAIIEKLKTK